MDWSSAGSNRPPDPWPGSWRPFEAPLRIEPRRSRTACIRLAVGYFAGCCALGLGLPNPVRLAGACLLLACGLLEIRSWRAGPLPAGLRCLVLAGGHAWSALGDDGSRSHLELAKVRQVTPSMIRVCLRPSSGGHGFDLELAADALPQEVHRRLRVCLAWFPRGAENVGRIRQPSA